MAEHGAGFWALRTLQELGGLIFYITLSTYRVYVKIQLALIEARGFSHVHYPQIDYQHPEQIIAYVVCRYYTCTHAVCFRGWHLGSQ